MFNTFDITDFGAVADGRTDCTAAIQKALNAAGKVKGMVVIPPARFLCGYVKVPAYVTVKGDAAWDFKMDQGGSVLELNDPNAKCLFDITGAFGCSITGISMDGKDLGEDVNGIMLWWEDRLQSRKPYGGAEDTPAISDCRISNFSGDAVHFHNIWCFSIRHSMLCYSRNGLSLYGCDGFISDCWFSCNRQSGIDSRFFMSGTFTGNRIECNLGHGASFFDVGRVQFSNNDFDYNALCGFYAADANEDFRGNIVLTGNMFHVSGFESLDEKVPDKYKAHINISHAVNVIINGNSFIAEPYTAEKCGPSYAVTFSQLKSSLIINNTMQNGAYVKNLNNLGGHKAEVVVSQNVGAENTVPTNAKSAWPRFDD